MDGLQFRDVVRAHVVVELAQAQLVSEAFPVE